jgi:hypothetical protein
MTTDFKEENLCVKVYDVDSKQVIATYDNYKRAGFGLGIPQQTIARRCKSKERIHSPKLGKEIAVRLTRKEAVAA